MFRAFLAKLLLRILSWFPLSVAHGLGRLIGRFFNSYSNELSRIARRNIELCFPELNEQQRSELVRESLMQTGMAILECGALWLWPVERVLKKVRKVSGWELMEKARSEGKGVVFAAPHLGAWEVIGLYSAKRSPMTCMYRPPKLTGLNQLIRKGRGRSGVALVPTDAGGVRALYKALSRGELVGILPDQDPGRGAGVFAPFFGIQANTMTLLSRLAGKSNTTVFMAYAERLPKGQGYHIHIMPAPECLADKDPVTAATCLNGAVEKCVRTLPGQYQWAYRRFKNRPEGEGRLYGREPLVRNVRE
ncbi:MAG: lysophospholipid acyltransferase family protein [Gammaproteobacteria bacterium]|nr:lysophospholipid acyltransferase family protein [Gammaproteobacteria bacterium]